jgi:hypothetical protein
MPAQDLDEHQCKLSEVLSIAGFTLSFTFHMHSEAYNVWHIYDAFIRRRTSVALLQNGLFYLGKICTTKLLEAASERGRSGRGREDIISGRTVFTLAERLQTRLRMFTMIMIPLS